MIREASFKLFGALTEPYLEYFDRLELSLKKAGMKIPVHEYLCTIIFISFLTFIISMIVGSFLITFMLLRTAYAYTLSIILSFVFSGMVFFFGYYFPSLQSKGVKGEIDKRIAFATLYMATSASSGVNPVEIFRMLSLRSGAIGQEAKKIYTNVKTLGMNLTYAIQKSASRSPSPSFADLLWGMSSVITSGGDLELYLKEKTETFMNQYRRRLSDYSKQISIYTEIYITLIIVGTLFFIILIAIIAPLVGMSVLLLQVFLVFFFIPLVSIGFVVLLKSISPI